VVATIREWLAVNEQGSQKFHVERFNIKKLNEAEGKEKYSIDIWSRVVSFDNLDAEVEINTVWETIRENLRF
jgi:hypothetical protein